MPNLRPFMNERVPTNKMPSFCKNLYHNLFIISYFLPPQWTLNLYNTQKRFMMLQPKSPVYKSKVRQRCAYFILNSLCSWAFPYFMSRQSLATKMHLYQWRFVATFAVRDKNNEILNIFNTRIWHLNQT